MLERQSKGAANSRVHHSIAKGNPKLGRNCWRRVGKERECKPKKQKG